MFPVDHGGGFRRIPGQNNGTESVYKPKRSTGISENQYTILEELVSIMNKHYRRDYALTHWCQQEMTYANSFSCMKIVVSVYNVCR